MVTALPRDFLDSLGSRGCLYRVSDLLRRHEQVDVASLAVAEPERASRLLCGVLSQQTLEPMETKYLACCLGQLGSAEATGPLADLAREHAAAGVRTAAAALEALRRCPAGSDEGALKRRRIIESACRGIRQAR